VSRRAWGVPVAVALALLACGRTAPKTHYFRLQDPSPAAGRASPVVPTVLEVGPFAARGLLGAERHILRSAATGAAELAWHEHRLWVEPPAEMVRHALVHYLREAHVFDRVVGREHQVTASHRLIGTLVALEHHPAPEVLIELDLSLIAVRERTVVGERRYTLVEPADDSSLEAAVAALDRAVARLAADVARDLAKSLR